MATVSALVNPNRSADGPAQRVWPWALLSLAFLSPFFFLTYGFANTLASRRPDVPSIVFGWEHAVPFLAWTIVPYWTSDLLYGLSVLVCTTRRELRIQVKRLLWAQVISVTCFLIFPLRCLFERPQTHGFFGWLFDVLLGFDKPFNQAPSLHVSLAVILWARFSAHLDGLWRTAMGAWLILVCVSTMTTYQHQFIDLPTGALAGLLAISLAPEKPLDRLRRRLQLATFYAAGALLSAAAALKLGGYGFILLWPATAVLLVALIYLADSPGAFRNPLLRIVAAPYIAAAWLNSRWWTRGEPSAQEIADGVWLGRAPGHFAGASIVNVAAELRIRTHGAACTNVPMLDRVKPAAHQLEQAVAAIEGFAARRPTLVCCALGYSRSAWAVASWLVATNRAASLEDAVAVIRNRRPRVVLDGVDNAQRI